MGNALIDAYAKFENVEDARQMFDSLSDKNVVSRGVVIIG